MQATNISQDFFSFFSNFVHASTGSFWCCMANNQITKDNKFKISVLAIVLQLIGKWCTYVSAGSCHMQLLQT